MVVTNINDPGQSETIVPAFHAPAGCVPVQQLHDGAVGSNPDVVPAPPRTAREAVDNHKCVRPNCKGLRQKGFTECAPHRLHTERVKATHGNIAEHQGLR